MHRLLRGPALGLVALLLLAGCRSGAVSSDDAPGTESGPWVPFEAVGRETSWDPITERARLAGASGDVVVGIGSRTALVGGAPFEMAGPARISAGRVQVGGGLEPALAARRSPVRPAATARPSVRAGTARPAPRIEPVPAHEPLSEPSPVRKVLLLDAGHGGRDPGTLHGKTYEKDLVLDLCRRMIPYLERAGFDVRLSRSDDRYVGLDERVSLVSRMGADLFVSVHVNANDRTDLAGFEVYHKSNPDVGGSRVVDESRRLAEAIRGAMREALPTPDRGVRPDVRGLRVLKRNVVPAVLVEAGYISNGSDRADLLDPSHRESVARSVATGIERYVRR